ncbi:MAG: GGDEF domain-containing protein, partial [Janthinobacterium sp.]
VIKVGNQSLRHRSGQASTVEYTANAIRAAGGEVQGSVLVFRDVTERRQLMQQISWQSNHDILTGLPNRSLVQVQLEQALTAAARGSTQLAVLFIDLDRFKQINDSLGHAAGDELLVHVAQRLRQVLRNSDMAGRLSGDEFVIALPQCDAVHVSETIERLRAALAAPLTIANTALSLSASIG